MKKILSLLICITVLFTLFGCSNTNKTSSVSNSNETQSSTSVNDSGETSSASSSQTSTSVEQVAPFKTIDYQPGAPQKPTASSNPTIFLAGDSTVKTYDEQTYIAGWGQYLQAFLNAENVTVVNKANGGRSSRSFINEGRLFTIEKFSNIGYTSIESEIKSGDYLLIQFGHNDEETNGEKFTNYIDRKVPLGEADENGVFPTTVPTQMASSLYLPKEYEQSPTVTDQDKISARAMIKNYGDYYYSFDCGGTFKGYLKMYIDFARAKGAIPILCTPVARVRFDSEGNTVIGGPGKHGPNFEYVTAVRQLAQEENCLLIDMFEISKNFLEITKKAEADLLMALKPNGIKGSWPSDYDLAYQDRVTYKVTGIEATHYNKYGAYIQAGKLAETLIDFATNNISGIDGEKINFATSILTTPTTFISPSTLMQASTVDGIKATFTKIKISE